MRFQIWIIILRRRSMHKKYFLYVHTRLDTNEIFYVGIGTQPKHGLLYQRAYVDYGRNPSWKGIVRQTNYTVRIIMESDVRSEVEAKEMELIAYYGRRDQGTGTLANRTDGGEKVKNASKGIKSKTGT